MTPTRMREIFAEELRGFDENRLAERVLDGSDSSHGGRAAIRAMQRVRDITIIEERQKVADSGQIRDKPREYHSGCGTDL